jgi:hypothetical protein
MTSYYWNVTVRVGEKGDHPYEITAPTEEQAAERATQEAVDEFDPDMKLAEKDVEAVAIECTGMVEP